MKTLPPKYSFFAIYLLPYIKYMYFWYTSYKNVHLYRLSSTLFVPTDPILRKDLSSLNLRKECQIINSYLFHFIWCYFFKNEHYNSNFPNWIFFLKLLLFCISRVFMQTTALSSVASEKMALNRLLRLQKCPF